MLDGVIESRGQAGALDAYEQVLKTNGPHDARFRLEHIETIDPDDLFQIPAREIYTSRVDLTIFDGAVIFDRR